MKKIIITLFAILLLGNYCFATSSDFQIEKGVLNKYTGSDEIVTIPDDVTIIEERAFYGLETIKEIVVPDSVETVEEQAFAGCTSLKKIKLSNKMTTIEAETFMDCEALEEVILPKNLETIKYYAFKNCTSLTNIDIPNSVKDIEEYAFDNTKINETKNENGMTIISNILLDYGGNDEKVIIPNGVITISAGVFKDNTSIKEIVIPESMIKIENNAFSGCTNLKEIVIPDSVQTVGEAVFMNCSSLREIVLPKALEYIGMYAFYGCSSLKEVTIPENVNEIGEKAFELANNVTLNVDEGSFAEKYAIENKIPYNNGEIRVVPTLATVMVNGNIISFDAYNINDNNYFKLRDLAYVLNGTEKGFGVKWDASTETMYLTSHTLYEEVGGEMTIKDHNNLRTIKTDAKIYVDNYLARFKAYNINDNNYFKLRDIGRKFDFGISWDGNASTISIDTSKTYIEEN